MSSIPTYGPFAAGPGRSVGQDDYLDFLGPMLQGNGVNSTDYGGSSLQVYADNSGLTVRVRPGSGMVRGVFYQTPSDVALTVASNGSTSTRVDRVVLSMSRSSQLATPLVITGTPGAGVPAMTQTVGGTWQIPLAQVQVPPSAGGIAPSNVSDDRQFLPLKLAVVNSAPNSSTPLPPADGTAGRIVYDRAVGGLLVTNGTKWLPLQVNDDTGWQPIDTTVGNHDPRFTPTFFGIRKRAGWVEFLVSGSWRSSTVSYPSNVAGIVCTLPAGFRPGVMSRSFDVPNSLDASGGPSHLDVGTDGVVHLVNPVDGAAVVASVGFFGDN